MKWWTELPIRGSDSGHFTARTRNAPPPSKQTVARICAALAQKDAAMHALIDSRKVSIPFEQKVLLLAQLLEAEHSLVYLTSKSPQFLPLLSGKLVRMTSNLSTTSFEYPQARKISHRLRRVALFRGIEPTHRAQLRELANDLEQNAVPLN